MVHHSKQSHRSSKRKHKNRQRPTLKHNAYRVVRHYTSKGPQRSIKNIHYAIRPLLPHRSTLVNLPSKKNRMNQEPVRASIARRAKSILHEKKEAEEALKEQERLQSERNKAERASIRHAKQEQKARHSANMSDLNSLFSRVTIKSNNRMLN